jgi:hypothetical protein
VFGFLLAICSSNSIVQGDNGEETHLSELIINYGRTSESTIYDWLKRLCACIDVYISKLHKSNEPSTSVAKITQQEEDLAELLKIGNVVIELMEKSKNI